MKTEKWCSGARVKNDYGFTGILVEQRDFNSQYAKVKWSHMNFPIYAIAHFLELVPNNINTVDNETK